LQSRIGELPISVRLSEQWVWITYDEEKLAGYGFKKNESQKEAQTLAKTDKEGRKALFQKYLKEQKSRKLANKKEKQAGNPIARLLEAFLIAQVKNKNGKPLYGVEIVGKHWTFVTMEGKEYCISNTYEATKKNDLLSIIAILRKFRAILYERLMD
jgi:hypothetical protein